MTRTRPEAIRIGDVLELAPGAAWRKVTGIREATHPLAASHGALTFDLVLWGDGRRMRPLTLFPDRDVCRVRTADEDSPVTAD